MTSEPSPSQAACAEMPTSSAPDSRPLNFFQNVDCWGAAEWFDRLAKAIHAQDKAVLEKNEIGIETYRNIAASSAMRLVREFEPEVRAALSNEATGARLLLGMKDATAKAANAAADAAEEKALLWLKHASTLRALLREICMELSSIHPLVVRARALLDNSPGADDVQEAAPGKEPSAKETC